MRLSDDGHVPGGHGRSPGLSACPEEPYTFSADVATRTLAQDAFVGRRARRLPLAWRAPLLLGAVAGTVGAAILWLGPPGADTAAHVYQLHLFRSEGFVTWDNYWYSGRHVFVTYSWLYYPLASLVGI